MLYTSLKTTRQLMDGRSLVCYPTVLFRTESNHYPGYRFFMYVVAGSFLWYWFPDYIWTGLSSFAFITWIWPNNQKVNALFGMNSGLGKSPYAHKISHSLRFIVALADI